MFNFTYFLSIFLCIFTACSTPCTRVIGVRYDPYTNIVDFAYPGSGADKVGITTGDKLVVIHTNTNDETVLVVIERNGESIIFSEVELSCKEDILTNWSTTKETLNPR